MYPVLSLRKRIAVLLICTFLFNTAFLHTGYAENILNPAQSVSLTIHYRSGDLPLSSISFDVYKVADVSTSLHFTLTDSFKDAPVSLEQLMDQSEWREMADSLEAYIRTNRIAPTADVQTDAAGEANIPNLSSGLYLVMGAAAEIDWKIYTPETALILLPNRSADGSWLYDAAMYPKPEIETIERLSRQVIKIWNDGGAAELRPEKLQVQLLKNGEPFETVTLTAKNGWTYRWTDLDGRYQWSVREPSVPNGYTAKLAQSGDRFIITNTLSGTVTPVPDDSLPQTGLTWWPVPVLALLGMALFLIGWLRQRRCD